MFAINSTTPDVSRKRFIHQLAGRVCLVLIVTICFMARGAEVSAATFASYFDGVVATNSNSIGAFTYDPLTNSFWTGSFGTSGQIRNIAYNGSAWAATGTNPLAANAHVTQTTWSNYIVADGTQTSASPNLNAWSGNQATVGGMALNPQPITINGNTYAPGTLMLMNHGGTVANGNQQAWTKRLYWYNMTETGTPTPVGNGSGVAPDKSANYTPNGVVDWNEQFMTILSHQDLLTVDGDNTSLTSSNLTHSFAFSSNGQSAYIYDANMHLGGIYKVNLTTTGSVTKLLDADGPSTNFINTEPTVVPTSSGRNWFGGSAVGDQIIVEGSVGLGNAGGLNAYLDDTNDGFSTTPVTVFTEAQFREFADWTGTQPAYVGVVSDAAGNLYIHDSSTSMTFKYDTQGRFSKVGSEEERNLYQFSQVGTTHDTVNDMQLRTTTAPGFAVPEILYSDTAMRSVGAIRAYKVGDFDQDNDVDATDLSAFLAALRPRGEGNSGNQNHVFNLNGNSTGTSGHAGSAPNIVANIASSIIDWKDVKILQQHLGFANGDTNLDGLLDFTDLDTMEANYYTLLGPADKTWGDGDFASLDPFSTIYSALASDANIVNLVDLELIADVWLNDLNQDNLTFADLDLQGYSGQFRLDLITAFDIQEDVLPSLAVPEPGSLLLLLGMVGLVARRKRATAAS